MNWKSFITIKYTSGSLSNELVYWSCGLGEFGTFNFGTLELLLRTDFFGQVVTLWTEYANQVKLVEKTSCGQVKYFERCYISGL